MPSRNAAHLLLLAARFRSLTVKREEAARETEADPLPMAALDFAGLACSENETREPVHSSYENCTPDGFIFCFVLINNCSMLQGHVYRKIDETLGSQTP